VTANGNTTKNTEKNDLNQFKTMFLLIEHCHRTPRLLRVLVAYQQVTIVLHSAHATHNARNSGFSQSGLEEQFLSKKTENLQE